ncbi:MAG: ribonuclease HII, partial [Candidatus Veblenbacteria bacterium]|nr:ribonuclease HII [Candidatus Veblenbacteria bacterium]
MLKPTLRKERRLWRQGLAVVAGVDEVGRGAWAGPLVAAAVIISAGVQPRPAWWRWVRDSKLLSPAARERVFASAAPELVWALGIVSSRDIDKLGVAEANRQAVRLAVGNLKQKPHYVLVDYVARLGGEVCGIPSQVMVDGDATVFSIALASIVAKVERDRLMRNYDKQYPGYGFAAHKGYGTREHRAALRRLDLSPLHRRSYRPVAAR